MANLLHHLVGKTINANFSRQQVAKIRREHDDWARTAQLGTVYYTALPHCQYDEQPGRSVHVRYVFTKNGSGHRAGQLITDTGNGSWDLWYQNGPLTTQRMPIADDYRSADEKAFAGAAARMQQQVAAQVEADMRRLYPASLQLVAA